jgi:hypothetical protein
MANRVAFQATQTKFFVDIIFRRQRKHHENCFNSSPFMLGSNIFCFDCQFTNNCDKKEFKKGVGHFQTWLVFVKSIFSMIFN